jgi:hypothetical protein
MADEALEVRTMSRNALPPFPLCALIPLVATSPLAGCFVFIDDTHDPGPPREPEPEPEPEPNFAPFIDLSRSYWACDWDADHLDYFFEFQAAVEDADGAWDVAQVDVSVVLADGSDLMLGTWGLLHEDGEIWGGLVWESESDLYCGEPVDIVIEAWDFRDAYDRVVLRF